MDWRYFLSPRGLNFWLVASGAGLSLIWAFFTLIFSFRALTGPEQATVVQLGLMVSFFVGNFLIGWLLGKWAGDNRGPTYGLYSSLGSVALALLVVLPSGSLGWLVAVLALLGGLNGGLVSLKRQKPPQR
ncbi:MAG: hypothetical protein JXM69_10925 [Anaerolineae bacterium]|nr:hypothetical protein [Anaerolineae bacterium]